MPRSSRSTHLPAFTLALSMLAGCASAPAPAIQSLTTATAPSRATSLKTAAVSFISGDLRGQAPADSYLSGNLLHHIPPDQIEPLLFNLQDQAALTTALHSNLARLQVFRSVVLSSAPQAPTDLKIVVVFAETHYLPASQQYTLNVTMQIQGGAVRFRKDYRVLSNPAGSSFSALRVSREQAKAAAAKALLEQLLPDIQAFALDQA